MGATSVTGVGQGDSHGLFKPELHCGGCGCGSFTEDEEQVIIKTRGCVTSNRQSNTAAHRAGGLTSIKVC